MTINNLTNRRCYACGCTWEGSFPCPTCGELSLTAKIAVDVCPRCIEAAADGIGEVDPVYCVAVVDIEIDGQIVRVCEQCSDDIAHPAG